MMMMMIVGDITSRLSKDTTLMGRTVALNVNVLLRTLIKTGGMLSLMVSLSWKLTLLMLMETPVTGLLQSVYDSHYQVLGTGAPGTKGAGERTGTHFLSLVFSFFNSLFFSLYFSPLHFYFSFFPHLSIYVL